jgi:hypothetical protein
LFDATKDGQKISPKWVAPDQEQEPYESRRLVGFNPSLSYPDGCQFIGRLWAHLTSAILAKDMEAATDAKIAVEDAQRELRRKREEGGEKYIPRFFELRNGRWVPKLKYGNVGFIFSFIINKIFSVPDDPQEAVSAVQRWIWSPPQV